MKCWHTHPLATGPSFLRPWHWALSEYEDDYFDYLRGKLTAKKVEAEKGLKELKEREEKSKALAEKWTTEESEGELNGGKYHVKSSTLDEDGVTGRRVEFNWNWSSGDE